MTDKNELTLQITKLVKDKNVKELRELAAKTPSIDFAEAANDIDDITVILFVFKTVPSEYTAEIFTELSSEQQNQLIELFTDAQLRDLVQNTYTDDLVDFLEDMPANLVNRVLQKADKETRQEVNTLLNYKPNTAGSIMATEYLQVRKDATVGDVFDVIQKQGEDAVTVYDIFVTDNHRNLLGVLDLKTLLFADRSKKVEDFLTENVISVNVSTDQEEVAHLISRYDKQALPVLNNDQKLVGIVTVDDIIDVISEETTEDIARMVAVKPFEQSYRETGVLSLFKSSVPWLIVLMVLGVFSSMIINKFEAQIATVIVMSSFIPVLLDGAGNAGSQSASLVIRSLALHEYEKNEYNKIILKEFLVGLLVALTVGLFTALFIVFEFSVGIVSISTINDTVLTKFSGDWWSAVIKISGIIGLTSFISIVVARFFGALLPLLAKLANKDPAFMSNPLLTTIVDITTLLIYFVLISIFF